MTLTVETRDLFTVPTDYYLAQCLSADFGVGKGIAVAFNTHFHMKTTLQGKYPNYLNKYRQNLTGDCIREGRVLNLITKERYWNKPTYDSLEEALQKAKEICVKSGIEKLAMPKIGCGLDRLSWERVETMIRQIFADINIDILVCVL